MPMSMTLRPALRRPSVRPATRSGPGQAAVAADHDVVQALLEHQRADRVADQFGDAGVQGLADDAADVVGAEDAAIDRDRPAGASRRRLTSTARRRPAPRRRLLHGLRQGRARPIADIVAAPSRPGRSRGASPATPRGQPEQHQRRDQRRHRAQAERRPARCPAGRRRCAGRCRDLGGQRFGARWPAAGRRVRATRVVALAQRQVAAVVDIGAPAIGVGRQRSTAGARRPRRPGDRRPSPGAASTSRGPPSLRDRARPAHWPPAPLRRRPGAPKPPCGSAAYARIQVRRQHRRRFACAASRDRMRGAARGEVAGRERGLHVGDASASRRRSVCCCNASLRCRSRRGRARPAAPGCGSRPATAASRPRPTMSASSTQQAGEQWQARPQLRGRAASGAV